MPETRHHYLSEPPSSFLRHLVGFPKKLAIASALAFLLITGVATYALFFGDSSKAPDWPPSGPFSMIMYYNDGKTVLWDSTKNPDSNSELSGAASHVKSELAYVFGYSVMKKGQWRVTTTLDAKLQQTAQDQIKAIQPKLDAQGVARSNLIAEDVTNGQIVAWVGGSDSSEAPDTLNGRVQVGSLMLPLTYAAVIEHTTNNGAGTVFNDTQMPLFGYPCTNPALTKNGGNCLQNYDLRYVGKVTLRQALGALRLVPAVQAGEQVGYEALPRYANNLTYEPNAFRCYYTGPQVSEPQETQCYTAAEIGEGIYARPQDLVQAYSTVSNNGKRTWQSSFTKIVVNGKVAYESVLESKPVLREDTAYIISDILSDPDASYLPGHYKPIFSTNGAKVSVISGLTDDGTVGSMVQYTTKYAVGFWILAQNSNSPIRGFTELITNPVTTGWLSAAHSNVTAEERARPSGIQVLPSSVFSFQSAGGTVGPSPSVDLYPGWYQP